jgi:hypothetical protein
MAQNYTIDCFAASQVGLTSLQNMENNFECLRTMFSGSSAPTDPSPGSPWFDTSKKILKVRDSTNGLWLGVHYSSTSARWWVYANVAGDGWVVDSSIADLVVAIKGGTQAYNIAGGTGGGSWTISGSTVGGMSGNHVHTIPNHDHTFGTIDYIVRSTDTGTETVFSSYINSGTTATGNVSNDHYHAVTFNAVWRPSAAVGTLQYPNI